jgi:Uma2 family endonuclease
MAGDSSARIKLTYQDYLAIPDDGRRHEIVGGEHVVNPAPSLRHQEVSVRLLFQLTAQVEHGGIGRVFHAPVDVRLSETDVMQPDIVVVTNDNREILAESHIEGPPDLVVEIVSPTTERLDRRVKLARYELLGVSEYWIVDPAARVIEPYVREEGRFAPPARHAERIESATIPGVAIDLGTIW